MDLSGGRPISNFKIWTKLGQITWYDCEISSIRSHQSKHLFTLVTLMNVFVFSYFLMYYIAIIKLMVFYKTSRLISIPVPNRWMKSLILWFSCKYLSITLSITLSSSVQVIYSGPSGHIHGNHQDQLHTLDIGIGEHVTRVKGHMGNSYVIPGVHSITEIQITTNRRSFPAIGRVAEANDVIYDVSGTELLYVSTSSGDLIDGIWFHFALCSWSLPTQHDYLLFGYNSIKNLYRYLYC